MRASPLPDLPKCLVCGTHEPQIEVVECALSATRHHRECWELLEKCAVYACGSRGWLPPTREPPSSPSWVTQPLDPIWIYGRYINVETNLVPYPPVAPPSPPVAPARPRIKAHRKGLTVRFPQSPISLREWVPLLSFTAMLVPAVGIIGRLRFSMELSTYLWLLTSSVGLFCLVFLITLTHSSTDIEFPDIDHSED